MQIPIDWRGAGVVVRRGGHRHLQKAPTMRELESSRLARNGSDWHQLLEFCSIVDTLIVNHAGV